MRQWLYTQVTRVIPSTWTRNWNYTVAGDDVPDDGNDEKRTVSSSSSSSASSLLVLPSQTGVTSARYIVPTRALQGYVSRNGEWLATVHTRFHQSDDRWKPKCEYYSSVAVYRVPSSISPNKTTHNQHHRKESSFDEAWLYKPWRIIAHPSPVCHDIVVSFDHGHGNSGNSRNSSGGYVAMRNEYILSVYQVHHFPLASPLSPTFYLFRSLSLLHVIVDRR
jgi:hypothetical protein